jgi:hypothetical protein
MSTSNNKPSPLTPKDVYEEIGRNYRFFLNWRYALIAGHLISLGFFAKILFQLWEQDQFVFLFLAFAVLFFLTKFFYELENRNRDLYHYCTEQGKTIETKIEIEGIYSKLHSDDNNKVKSKYSHSNTINWFFKFWFFALPLTLLISFGLRLFNHVCK